MLFSRTYSFFLKVFPRYVVIILLCILWEC